MAPWRSLHPRRLGARLLPALALLSLTVGCDAIRDVSAAAAGPFRGVELAEPAPAPELALATATGDTFDLAAQRGQAVLLFFGYTHCPDICPTTLSDWAQVADSLGADARRVRFVFVSVDPERDTPGVAEAYATRFNPEFIGLSAPDSVTARLRGSLNLVAQSEPAGTDGDYGVAHSSQVFLVDPEGRLRLLYPFGSTAQDMLLDVRRLLR